MTETQRIVTLVATVLAGLSAGVFFAFSTFVTPALDRLAPSASIAAMQSMNKLAPTSLFMVTLFTPLLLGGYVAATGLRRPGGVLVLAATVCALVAVVVTAAYHVPRNDALASADLSDPGRVWHDFYGGWQAWNHVRTVAFTVSTALFALAVRAD